MAIFLKLFFCLSSSFQECLDQRNWRKKRKTDRSAESVADQGVQVAERIRQAEALVAAEELPGWILVWSSRIEVVRFIIIIIAGIICVVGVVRIVILAIAFGGWCCVSKANQGN